MKPRIGVLKGDGGGLLFVSFHDMLAAESRTNGQAYAMFGQPENEDRKFGKMGWRRDCSGGPEVESGMRNGRLQEPDLGRLAVEGGESPTPHSRGDLNREGSGAGREQRAQLEMTEGE